MIHLGIITKRYPRWKQNGHKGICMLSAVLAVGMSGSWLGRASAQTSTPPAVPAQGNATPIAVPQPFPQVCPTAVVPGVGQQPIYVLPGGTLAPQGQGYAAPGVPPSFQGPPYMLPGAAPSPSPQPYVLPGATPCCPQTVQPQQAAPASSQLQNSSMIQTYPYLFTQRRITPPGTSPVQSQNAAAPGFLTQPSSGPLPLDEKDLNKRIQDLENKYRELLEKVDKLSKMYDKLTAPN